MQYPSKLDYDNAVWNLSKTARCTEFQGGIPRNDGLDLVHYTGGFSRVYLIDIPARSVVLRVWLNEIQNVQPLYKQAEKFFEKRPNPYFVNFHYIQNGIEVNQQVWPILFMEWVDGLTLNQFLDANLPHSPRLVEAVADQFLNMTRNLHQEGISHGDLQDGNIIVTKHPSQTGLKLIDYDTLHIPRFNDFKRQAVGVSGYQHPRRSEKDVEKQKWDYFSELVIYLSLCVYTEKPELWKYQQEKALLFSRADFNDPENSPIFKTLNTLSIKVRRMAEHLINYCHETDVNQLQPLEEVISSINQPNNSAPPNLSVPSMNSNQTSSVSQGPRPSSLEDFFRWLFTILISSLIFYGIINGKIIDVPSTLTWQYTGFQVGQGDIIIAYPIWGKWSADFNNPDFPMVDANGYKKELLNFRPNWSYSDWCVEKQDSSANWPLGVLIAGVSDSTTFIQVGSANTFQVKNNGDLFLGMNDCSFDDNYGSLKVWVTRYPNIIKSINNLIAYLRNQ